MGQVSCLPWAGTVLAQRCGAPSGISHLPQPLFTLENYPWFDLGGEDQQNLIKSFFFFFFFAEVMLFTLALSAPLLFQSKGLSNSDFWKTR